MLACSMDADWLQVLIVEERSLPFRLSEAPYGLTFYAFLATGLITSLGNEDVTCVENKEHFTQIYTILR